jgi:hypothetical protein
MGILTTLLKWLPGMVPTYGKNTDISDMLWGAIRLGGRSNLVLLERDEEPERGGYSANSYLEIGEEEMLKYFEPDRIFMQDNASIDTAKEVTQRVEDEGTLVLDWLRYSP